jgi:peptidyl-prolyl cis-trans isomerase D
LRAFPCLSYDGRLKGRIASMTMLDRMRRHKNWLKWSLGLVVLAFVVFYIPDFLQQDTATVGASPREVIAEVDGRPLTAGEFQQRYVAQVQAYRTQFGGAMNDQLLRQLNVDQQILTQMIDEEVAVVEAERQGIEVTDDELAQQIFAIPGLQENGRFIGQARYEALLRSQVPPLSRAQFEERMRRGLVIDRLRTAVTDWIAVSDQELDREYRTRNEKVKLRVVSLNADAFRDKVTVTDADVSAHYEANKNSYRVAEQRSIRYLLLDRDQARLKVTVPAADIQRYYNSNISQYQTPEQVRASHILLKTEGKDEAAVRKQAEAVLAQVKGGADFAALARKVSEDTSKDQGGDLDFFARGRMVPEFETAAFAMAPGQTSELVKSQFGFHIIRVTDKRPGTIRTLDEVRAQIQDTLQQEIADQQLSTRAQQLQARIKDPGDLAEAAGENGLTVQESGFFQRTDPVPGLGQAPQVASDAFTLADGAVSGALVAPRGVVFMTVAGKKDAYVPNLEEVKDRVREDTIRARAAELSRQRAASVAAALKTAPDFAAAAKAQGLESKDTDLVTRESALPDIGVSTQVDRVAFALPVGGVSDPIVTDLGTVIVKVVERDDVTPDEFRTAREQFRTDLLNERRGRFFSAYMGKVKERLSVQVKGDVVNRIVTSLTSL